MINIKQIKIENFVKFKNVDLTFSKENDAYFISGENRVETNQESNGAGKSLFCTAFVWCLFEDNLRKGVKRDDVIGEFGEYCRVVLNLEASGKEIRVERTRDLGSTYENSVSLFVDGEDRSHPTSKRKTTSRILDILGLPDRKVFYHCAYFKDKDDTIVALTPSELKKTVSEILNMSKYDDWMKECRDKERELGTEIPSLETEVQNIKNNKLELLEDSIKELNKDIKKFNEEKQKRISLIEDEIEEVESDIDDCKKLINKKEDVESTINNLKDKKEKREKTIAKIKSKKRERKKLKKDKNRLEKKVNKIENKKKEIKKNLDNLQSGTQERCRVCGNLVSQSDKLEEKIKEFEDKFNEKQSEYTDNKYNLSAKKKEISELNNYISKLEKKKSKQKEELEDYYKAKNKLEKIESAESNLKKLNKKLDKLEKRLEKQENKTVESKKEKLEEKKNEYKEAEKELENKKSNLDEKRTDKEAYSILENVIEEIKNARFNNFMNNFQNYVNENLKKLTGGDFSCRVVEVDDSLEVRFTSSGKGGRYLNWHLFSDGEQARIAKAVFVAINDIVGLDFLIDDEGTENIDDAGISDVLDFIKESDKTLFFVSHSAKAKDYCRDVPNIHITKELDDQNKPVSSATVR